MYKALFPICDISGAIVEKLKLVAKLIQNNSDKAKNFFIPIKIQQEAQETTLGQLSTKNQKRIRKETGGIRL